MINYLNRNVFDFIVIHNTVTFIITTINHLCFMGLWMIWAFTDDTVLDDTFFSGCMLWLYDSLILMLFFIRMCLHPIQTGHSVITCNWWPLTLSLEMDIFFRRWLVWGLLMFLRLRWALFLKRRYFWCLLFLWILLLVRFFWISGIRFFRSTLINFIRMLFNKLILIGIFMIPQINWSFNALWLFTFW